MNYDAPVMYRRDAGVPLHQCFCNSLQSAQQKALLGIFLSDFQAKIF